MEQLPNWLAAAVNAAGMATVYNADDWSRSVDNPAARQDASDAPRSPPMPH
jgi:hypothetical protein